MSQVQNSLVIKPLEYGFNISESLVKRQTADNKLLGTIQKMGNIVAAAFVGLAEVFKNIGIAAYNAVAHTVNAINIKMQPAALELSEDEENDVPSATAPLLVEDKKEVTEDVKPQSRKEKALNALNQARAKLPSREQVTNKLSQVAADVSTSKAGKFVVNHRGAILATVAVAAGLGITSYVAPGTLTTIATAARDKGVELGNKAAAGAQYYYNDSVAQKYVNVASDKASEYATKAGELLSTVGSSVKDGVISAGSTVKGAAGTALEGAISAGSTVKSTVVNGAASAASYFRSAEVVADGLAAK